MSTQIFAPTATWLEKEEERKEKERVRKEKTEEGKGDQDDIVVEKVVGRTEEKKVKAGVSNEARKEEGKEFDSNEQNESYFFSHKNKCLNKSYGKGLIKVGSIRLNALLLKDNNVIYVCAV